jgi:class 3 adenylate cyclase
VATDRVRYARVGDASIAYRVLGERGPYLANVSSIVPGLLLAEHPATRRAGEWMLRVGRPVVFDVQGTGRSDPLPPGIGASVESEAEQLIAVLTAAGIAQAYLLATDAGAAVAISVAVQRPDLVSGLVLTNAFARVLRDDDYPWGVDRVTLARWLRARHGTGVLLDIGAPSVAHDPEVREFWMTLEEQLASPAQARALACIYESLDVRSLLPQVQAPTLVMHAADNALFPIEHGRYLAEHIPNARFVEAPGRDHIALWESGEFFDDEAEAFITGTRPTGRAERVLAGVLFTDLVASTEHARKFGDRRWRRLLDEYERRCAEQIERFRGRLVRYTGDGVLATFGSASDAVGCATALVPVVGRLGVDIHSGIHVGDIERRGDDIGGTTVNVAARVMESAGRGEVLVTINARDAAVGSGLRFSEAGAYQLKGFPEPHLLYRAEPD